MGALVDLVGEDGSNGPEVVESSASTDVVVLLTQLAPRVRSSLQRSGKLLDCRHSTSQWSNALRDCIGVSVFDEADPDEIIPADFLSYTEAERGGYEIADGILTRHAWLLLGPDLLMFDPTAHQFDFRGPIRLESYWLARRGGRIDLASWRATQVGPAK